ncbi:MAG: AAA family ATPase [Euryarchaeota archaeon]|jgi:2-phosphoglycerate kinase|nr:AAA family ATPase [Euryarchaeota archaeon]
MADTVGMHTSVVSGLRQKQPRLVLIAGASGVGKSTISIEAAKRLGFARIISTDAIREVMRSCDPERNIPRLHRSSFTRGEAGDPVLDWKDSCRVVEAGIDATIARARREGIDLIIEGVHLMPDNRWLEEWREQGGIAIGFIMIVEVEETHISMLKERDAHSWRKADRYLAAFDRIRAIQNGAIDLGRMKQWDTLNPTTIADPVDRIEHWLDLEWNKSIK